MKTLFSSSPLQRLWFNFWLMAFYKFVY